jgi:hypothetical protein
MGEYDNRDDELVFNFTKADGTEFCGGRMFARDGDIFVFCPPDLAKEIVINDQHGEHVVTWPELPLKHGTLTEMDGAVCFRWNLSSTEASEESLLYMGRLKNFSALPNPEME